jgi:tetratricopeptide (TPR) repeat protein
MNKKIFIFTALFFTINAHASVSQEKYKQAFRAYKSKDYVKSFDLFSSFYLTRLSDKRVNYFLGRSAYKTQHYETALAAFERVSMLDPSNIRNQLEMARTYFKLKMFEDAESIFKSVLAIKNLPQNVRENIEFYLSRVAVAEQKSFTYIGFSASWVYDSNVNYGSSEDEYFLVPFGGYLGTSPAISDSAKEYSIDLTNIYDIGSQNGFAIVNKAMAYVKKYNEQETYNIAYYSYIPSIMYKKRSFTAELSLGLDMLTLADKEYLKSYSVTPRVEWMNTSTLKSMIHLKYQSKYFQQEAQQDSVHREVSLGLQKMLSSRSLMQVNLVGVQEMKTRKIFKSIYTNYKEYKLNLSYMNQFSSIFGMQLSTEVYNRKYEDKSTLFKNPLREDKSGSVNAGFTTNIIYGIRANIKATYAMVKSNQAVYSYKKHTFTIGLGKTF